MSNYYCLPGRAGGLPILFNASAANGTWGGGSFASALSLTGNTSYFVGFSGWQSGSTTAPGQIGGINWVAWDPNSLNLAAQTPPSGTEFLSPAFFDTTSTTGFGTEIADPSPLDQPTSAPVIRFLGELQSPTNPPPTGVPEPSALLLLGIGLAGLAARRRRT